MDQAAVAPPVYTEEFAGGARRLAAGMRPIEGDSWQRLASALERSLAYVSTRRADEIAVAHGDVAIVWSEVRRTLERLRTVLPRLDAEPHLLGEHFRWLRLTQGADFSGYYEPRLRASLKPREGYRTPLYAKPDDLRTLQLGDFEDRLIGRRIQYRVRDGRAVPYYSRKDIEKGALKGKGLELAYAADPLDAYFLQVQGSGRLLFPDGSERSILYAATNGRPYTGIGRVLYDEGKLPGPVTMPALREWLERNPEEAREVMRRNERYVFFRFAEAGPAEGPIGGMGQLLTPWASLAADPHLLPLGAPVVFAVSAPFPEGVRDVFSLGFAQDTGAAIHGRRLDLFCGTGDRAAYSAGRLNTPGAAWLLVLKE
jgi:Membrane-bound lytic murein transglycosylase